MKKRSCRMTSEEREIHEFAVKVRKMTDRQIYDFVTSQKKDTNRVNEFLDTMESKSISGIGQATIKKIKDFAIKEGFILEA